MAKNLSDEFQDIQAFINQLEGAKLIDETGKPYTMTRVRGPEIHWGQDPKRVIYTAKYDDGTEVNVVTLGDAYFHKHQFVKPTPEELARREEAFQQRVQSEVLNADIFAHSENEAKRIKALAQKILKKT